jgi:hypothetical protein
MLGIGPRKGGGFTLTLEPEEAAILLSLPGRLRRVLQDPDFTDRVVRRLFPPTYGDAELEAEHRRLLGEDLTRMKLQALEAFERSLEKKRKRDNRVEVTIEESQFDLWLSFVNDMRVLLGTELDIRDDSWHEMALDPDDPRAGDLALLEYLTWLEAALIETASEA